MTPTRAPRTDAHCWPFPCHSWHETADHLDGRDPCACPCHAPEPERDYSGHDYRPIARGGTRPCPRCGTTTDEHR